ncbi:MAG TPA: rhodanese-like domain-containing protein [Tepidisphaeraceae bacterium]
MQFERFEVPGLAHYSYLLGSQGKAVVIDPKRDVDTYLKYAEAHGLNITHVLETHIHADYASGARQLAGATNAELWLSGHDRGEDFQYRFAHHHFRDGEELLIGDLRIVALHTPGHTPEHLSFLIYEKSRCGQPMALLTGDFLFVGSLGRPDLLGDDAKQKLAGELYESVHEKIARLPDGVEIHPAHGAGSLCGAGMSERPQSTLGYERFCNVFMADREKAEFVETVLKSVPEFPDYYRRMKRINSEGAPILDSLPGLKAIPPMEVQEALNLNAVIIDLRRPEAFGGAHIPGSFNIGSGQNLSMWAAWVVPYDHPIILAGDDGTNIEEACRALIRVGFDGIRGYLKGGMKAWIEAGLDQAHVPQMGVRELSWQLKQSDKPFVLDVRSPAEWKAGHIEGAVHIPGGSLPNHIDQIPPDLPVHVVCGSGYRSSIATSVLQRAGRRAVINVDGGMGAWNAQHLPTTREE